MSIVSPEPDGKPNSPRKAISRRLRYEILRRDGNTCRYCGLKAGETELTIDHVVPVALGGTDDPTNLVAACKDCNAGKSSVAPGAELVADVNEDAARWAAAVQAASAAMLSNRNDVQARRDRFLEVWWDWDMHGDYLPRDWAHGVDLWLDSGLPEAVLHDCVRVALRNRNVAHDAVFQYMGGIARNRIGELHDAARRLLDGE